MIELSQNEKHGQALQETGYWGKCGAGVLFYKNGKVILALRSEYVEQPLTYGTIGGAVDDFEQPVDAARREVDEESGVEVTNDQLKELFIFIDGSFQYHNFICELPCEVHELYPTQEAIWETVRFEAFTLDELKELPNLHFGIQKILNDQNAMNKLEYFLNK